ncbi:MAG: hypothetical protein AAF081_20210, partial [Actinomycetota bacterium]
LDGKPDDQRRVLEMAEADAEGVLAYGVQSSLATLELEAGKGDAAVDRLRELADRKDVLGEQASLDLGRVLETLDRNEEARKVYDAFETQWPESTRLDEVREHKKALAGLWSSCLPRSASPVRSRTSRVALSRRLRPTRGSSTVRPPFTSGSSYRARPKPLSISAST